MDKIVYSYQDLLDMMPERDWLEEQQAIYDRRLDDESLELLDTALEFVSRISERYPILYKSQTCYAFPREASKKGAKVFPIYGWKGCVPFTDVPKETYDKEWEQVLDPWPITAQLDPSTWFNSGVRPIANFETEDQRRARFEEKMRLLGKYTEGTPSAFFAENAIELFYPDHPTRVYWVYENVREDGGGFISGLLNQVKLLVKEYPNTFEISNGIVAFYGKGPLSGLAQVAQMITSPINRKSIEKTSVYYHKVYNES